MSDNPTNDQGQQGGTPGGAPAPTTWGEWINSIPEAIRGQIPDDAKKAINDGWLRQQDYTKKTQEVAPLRDLTEKYKGRDLGKELERLQQWDSWHKSHWPNIERQLKDAETRNRGQGASPNGQEPGQGGQPARGPVMLKATPDDFFDEARLNKVLGDMERTFAGGAMQAVKHWYANEELPRLDKVVESYVKVYNALFGLIWPKDLPPLDDVLKHAAASGGEVDLSKVVSGMTGKKKEIEDAAYQRGLEEGTKRAGAANPPSPAPPGSGMPAWTPPAGTAKTEDALYQEVMADVSKRHGTLPA